MAQLTTLARPYARAAFETALQDGELQSWAGLLRLAAAVAEESSVKARLSQPSASGEQQAQILISLLGDEAAVKQRSFLKVLAENKRLPLLSEITVLFDDLKAEQEKRVEVEVVSAFALSDATQQKLVQALQNRLQREVSLNTSVDKSLIGGLVIHAGDMVIDGSLRGRLNKLAETINA